MVLNHIAALFFFSGPLFYLGLLLAIYPTGVATIPQWLFREVRRSVRTDLTAAPDYCALPRRFEKCMRAVGVVLLLIAIVI